MNRILAVLGMVLVWSPLLATIVTSALGSAEAGSFHFDFLMPAELFPVALTGGGLLFLAALMVHSHRAIIGWGLGAAMVALAGGQALAVFSGLATGEIAPAGWYWNLVIASIALYTLALVVIGVGGVQLALELLRSTARKL